MGKLFLVPTPVGNMEDFTFRAVEVLKKVQTILAEDTRTSSKLLNHFDIHTPCRAYHQFNEHQICEEMVNRLQCGEDIAVITDAGTPGISDPGFLLVRSCIEHEIEVECLPGATAFVPALVQSGFPCERFVFEGFLPHRKGRNARMAELALQERTMILYESPHRIEKTLDQLSQILGPERKACVCREISKLYAENRRGNLEELRQHYQNCPPKGEIVLIVEGRDRECYTYAYPRAALTVDIILIAVLKQSPYLLLIERGKPPFEGCFAFPGGFVNEDETLEWAAGRELKEETGFWIKNYNLEFKAFKPYSDPQRDPRGRTITMVYSTILHTDHLPEVCGGDDASKALWFPINELPSLAFDHKKIIQDFLNSYHPEKLQ